ncbi:hypothetical protein P4B35_23780 [Pontiellaceae bacterium B12227]|nr:hypothetical protein [Pontiellaceae bacterium B12227]
MKIISTLVLSFCFLTFGCQSSSTKSDNQNVIDEIKSYRNNNAFGGIPENEWPELIEKIDAVRIYHHLANIAIVLEEDEKTESGIYVYQQISSYLPENSRDWKFEEIGKDIWKYTHQK